MIILHSPISVMAASNDSTWAKFLSEFQLYSCGTFKVNSRFVDSKHNAVYRSSVIFAFTHRGSWRYVSQVFREVHCSYCNTRHAIRDD